MQRRFFLKAVAALSTVPLIKVPDFRVIAPSEALLTAEQWFANVRELSAYDIGSDQMHYRWDLWDGTNQWGIDFMASCSPEDLIRARKEASIVLADGLRHSGIDLRSLKPMPIASWGRVPSLMA